MAKECVAAWLADTSKERATNFDRHFPNCGCEHHSFSGKNVALPGCELMARIMTTPGTYDETANEILWPKLIRVYSDGLSMFRPGCSEREVRNAIERLLTGGAEPQSLYGAALVTVGTIRGAGQPTRWFCVYDTPAQEFVEHADIIGTAADSNLSKTKQAKERESRMRGLRNEMGKNIVRASTPEELISGLRASGFAINSDVAVVGEAANA